MPRLNWGAVIVGTVAGLAAGLILFALISLLGSSPTSSAILIFVQYLTQFGAGYLAARLAIREPLLHGGAAALSLFAVASLLTLALTTGRPAVWVVAFSGLVAAVLGSAGGSLAESLRLRTASYESDSMEQGDTE